MIIGRALKTGCKNFKSVSGSIHRLLGCYGRPPVMATKLHRRGEGEGEGEGEDGREGGGGGWGEDPASVELNLPLLALHVPQQCHQSLGGWWEGGSEWEAGKVCVCKQVSTQHSHASGVNLLCVNYWWRISGLEKKAPRHLNHRLHLPEHLLVPAPSPAPHRQSQMAACHGEELLPSP